MSVEEQIEMIERAWSEPDGFLFLAHIGRFTPEGAATFLADLERIDVPSGDTVDRRLVSLLWFIPTLLEWNRHANATTAERAAAYDRISSVVVDRLFVLLGVP